MSVENALPYGICKAIVWACTSHPSSNAHGSSRRRFARSHDDIIVKTGWGLVSQARLPKGKKSLGTCLFRFGSRSLGIILPHVNGMLFFIFYVQNPCTCRFSLAGQPTSALARETSVGFGRGLFYQLWMLWSYLTTTRFFWLCVQAMLRLVRLQRSTQNGDGESSLSSHG